MVVFICVKLFILFQCDEQKITRFDECNLPQRGSYLSKVRRSETQCGLLFSTISQPCHSHARTATRQIID